MFSLKERPYSAHVVISFWCYFGNKNYDFFRFRILADNYFSFVHFGYFQNLLILLYAFAQIISKYLQYAYWP